VIGNQCKAEALAKVYGVEFRHIPVTAETKSAAEEQQLGLLKPTGIDLIVLARYMQILSPEFVRNHSFLPAFMGEKPYYAAFRRGVKLIGATSHYVTAALDDGPIIEQDVLRVSHRDQVEAYGAFAGGEVAPRPPHSGLRQ
jgi:formyltetrahydrofolate deformylase